MTFEEIIAFAVVMLIAMLISIVTLAFGLLLAYKLIVTKKHLKKVFKQMLKIMSECDEDLIKVSIDLSDTIESKIK